MKRIKSLLITLLPVIFIFFNTSCKKDKISPATLSATDSVNIEINQFIWNGMKYYYLWTDSVSYLTKFTSETNLDAFLNGYSDHEKLFDDLLYPTRDKWSWIVDDYTTLENLLQGISKSMGYSFQLVRMGTSNNIFGYVQYIVKGSPAYLAGMKRGDLFIKVNDQQLTVDNYESLLINNDSYKLSFATISGNTISSNNVSVNLTAVELDENPIYLDSVYTINGTKLGYLVYNQFVPNYDIQLNHVFQYFKSENIQKLILDLRYNPGGSGQSAAYLASMIYGTNTSNVFIQEKFNNNLETYLQSNYGSNYFINYFEDSIKKSGNVAGELINSVGLKDLYIITSKGTASASELIINGLRPYITVTTIGDTTVGKYVGSITIYDYDQNGVYDSYIGEYVNSKHKWAMQPIVVKSANKNGQSDYYKGFAPAQRVSEIDYLTNLSTLGDLNEPLLKATVSYMFNLPQKKAARQNSFIGLADSKDLVPHTKEMYFDSKHFNANKLRKRVFNK